MNILSICLIVICSIAMFFIGIYYKTKKIQRSLSTAQDEAEKIILNAKEIAETCKKEAIIEGKDEIHKLRNECEKEISERRHDIQRQERRILQKEENIDKKLEHLEEKEEALLKKQEDIERKNSEIDVIRKNQFDMLEKISGFSVNQAKSFLLESLQDELIHEKALKITLFEQQLKEECDKKAKNILSMAVQRCASDYIVESTISVVPLPNEEMKGRIIGREGRNIRAIESSTGVDLIIDDTPESITLSAFDPVRREIARVAVEKLILDGRIHPAKIEEIVEKSKLEVEAEIKEEGQRAVISTGINGMNPELIKILGKLKYRTSYGQNVLNHSIEVANLCGIMASELGLDVILAKRIGLLHDIGKALDHEMEGSHIELGINVARKYRESELVIHAIHSHHGDVEPKTPYEFILQAADTASAARPGARRENIENYIKRLEKLENIVSSFAGVKSCYAIQAGREVRVMLNPEIIDDENMIPLARDICNKIENELDYPGQIKVNVIRESRASDFAK